MAEPTIDELKQQLAEAKELFAARDRELTELANVRARERQEHAAALAQKDKDAQALLVSQSEKLKAEHVADVAALKESVLIPLMKKEHERQLAELAAKQRAEIEDLKGR